MLAYDCCVGVICKNISDTKTLVTIDNTKECYRYLNVQRGVLSPRVGQDTHSRHSYGARSLRDRCIRSRLLFVANTDASSLRLWFRSLSIV